VLGAARRREGRQIDVPSGWKQLGVWETVDLVVGKALSHNRWLDLAPRRPGWWRPPGRGRGFANAGWARVRVIDG
jgi:hypothetical protein